MASVKDRLILGIGLTIIERPRELQHAAGQDEHHVVHVLYLLHDTGLVAYKRRKGKDRPGVNLTSIQLTPKGIEKYKELRHNE